MFLIGLICLYFFETRLLEQKTSFNWFFLICCLRALFLDLFGMKRRNKNLSHMTVLRRSSKGCFFCRNIHVRSRFHWRYLVLSGAWSIIFKKTIRESADSRTKKISFIGIIAFNKCAFWLFIVIIRLLVLMINLYFLAVVVIWCYFFEFCDRLCNFFSIYVLFLLLCLIEFIWAWT